MRSALAPGTGLDEMNCIMIQNIAAFLDKLVSLGEKPTNVQLGKWIRNAVTLATTDAVDGPQNPFKDQAVEDGFW